MILDKSLQFDPSGTAITSTAASTNIIDLLNPRDMAINGDGPDLQIVVTIIAALLAAGAATLQIQLQAAPDNGSGSPGSYVTLVQTDAIPKANLTLGQQIKVPLPPVAAAPQFGTNPALPRFYRLNYVVATGPFTAGSIEADLVVNPQSSNPPNYPAGFSVPN